MNFKPLKKGEFARHDIIEDDYGNRAEYLNILGFEMKTLEIKADRPIHISEMLNNKERLIENGTERRAIQTSR